MNIFNLKILNFRSIADEINLNSLPNICIFIGPNNSGKSNILKSIEWFSQVLTKMREFEPPKPGSSINADEFHPNRHGREEGDNGIRIEMECKIKDVGYHIILFANEYMSGNFRFGITLYDSRHPNYCILKYDEKNGKYVTESGSEGRKTKSNPREMIEAFLYQFGGYNQTPTKIATLPDIRGIDIRELNSKSDNRIESYSILLEKVIAHDSDSSLRRSMLLRDFVSYIIGEKYVELSLGTSGIDNQRNINISFPERTSPPRTMPLSNMGSGTRDMVLLGIELASPEKEIFLIEEPEIHLHADWQRILFDHLQNLSNEGQQFFISTHSSVILDAAREAIDNGSTSVGIYHVAQNENGSTVADRCDTDLLKQAGILDDLGCRASEILQANSVIWVEGPSDSVLIRKWIELKQQIEGPDTKGKIKEGVHFVFAQFGGSNLASHVVKEENEIDYQFNMYKINRHSIVVVDKDNEKCKWAKHKERVRNEIEMMGGLFWQTDGEEIENYISDKVWDKAKFDKESNMNKHERARTLAKSFDEDDLDEPLSGRIEVLIQKIREWNGI